MFRIFRGPRRTRRLWLLALGGAAAVALAASPVFAHLPASTFEADDGDMADNTNVAPHVQGLDWASAPNRVDSVGELSNSQQDDSFGQGTKEDTEVPTVIDGSIPNNKSDLTSFSIANETAGGDEFLYLRWRRANTLGTANMDFELNQSSQDSGNGVTPERTENDILITFDFDAGGRNPDKLELGFLRWITDEADKAHCEASNSVPCWGFKTLLGSAVANGAVNKVEGVDDPITGENDIAILTFGEAAVNLTDAGIIAPGSCNPFASAYLKSRASTSFTAATKDFIAPVTLNFQTCGTINIQKNDDEGNPLEGATFQLFLGDPTVGPPASCSGAAVSPAVTCTTDANGQCSMTDVPFGDYCVKETVVPDGFVGADPQDADLTESVATITLTFVNSRTFRIITIVCLETDDTLWPSSVSLNSGAAVTSLAAGDLPAIITQQGICTLGGAVFNGRKPSDTNAIDVTIPSSQ